MASDEVAKPSSIPPYPEMILGAIEALDEKGGSNKSAISNYIEGKYAELLPESHDSLLSAHLQRMKDGGEIMMIKNNYMKPDADAPPDADAMPKRGRGRPPKPKSEAALATVSGPPRPRGRPPKAKDPLAVAVAKAASGLPRPRGRPPKKASPAGEAGESAASAGAAAAASPAAPSPAAPPVLGVKRGRGRPPKVKPQFADVGFA